MYHGYTYRPSKQMFKELVGPLQILIDCFGHTTKYDRNDRRWITDCQAICEDAFGTSCGSGLNEHALGDMWRIFE